MKSTYALSSQSRFSSDLVSIKCSDREALCLLQKCACVKGISRDTMRFITGRVGTLQRRKTRARRVGISIVISATAVAGFLALTQAGMDIPGFGTTNPARCVQNYFAMERGVLLTTREASPMLRTANILSVFIDMVEQATCAWCWIQLRESWPEFDARWLKFISVGTSQCCQQQLVLEFCIQVCVRYSRLVFTHRILKTTNFIMNYQNMVNSPSCVIFDLTTCIRAILLVAGEGFQRACMLSWVLSRVALMHARSFSDWKFQTDSLWCKRFQVKQVSWWTTMWSKLLNFCV